MNKNLFVFIVFMFVVLSISQSFAECQPILGNSRCDPGCTYAEDTDCNPCTNDGKCTKLEKEHECEDCKPIDWFNILFYGVIAVAGIAIIYYLLKKFGGGIVPDFGGRQDSHVDPIRVRSEVINRLRKAGWNDADIQKYMIKSIQVKEGQNR